MKTLLITKNQLLGSYFGSLSSSCKKIIVPYFQTKKGSAKFSEMRTDWLFIHIVNVFVEKISHYCNHLLINVLSFYFQVTVCSRGKDK